MAFVLSSLDILIYWWYIGSDAQT